MSDSWHHARTLAQRAQAELPEDAEIGAELAERLERSVVEALRQRRARQLRRRASWATASAVVAAAAAIALWPRPLPRAQTKPLARAETTTVQGELHDVSTAAAVVPGALPQARMLRSGSSTILQLTPSSRAELRHALVVVERAGRSAAFVLDRGALSLSSTSAETSIGVDVAQVHVDARDADVDIERSGAECGQPRVRVHRGQVTVDSPNGQRMVRAGDEWSECPTTIATTPVASAPTSALRPAAPGSLQEQNEALAEAVRARRAGRTDEALRAYASFLRRWPEGALAEVARADRMNLLASRDPSAAQRAAREYLRHHPNGPARDRARTLLGERP